jgi:predicted nucleic acid-binding protein
MRKVLFDTIFLSMLLHQKDRFPRDPTTDAPVANPKERIEYLIEILDEDDAKILIPTQAIAELLAAAGASGPLYLTELHGNSVFEIVPFDERAAIENGALEASGARRVGDAPRQKIKVDRQIVAIARTHGVEAIYSDDGDIKALGLDLGLRVISVSELSLRPAEPVPPLIAISEVEPTEPHRRAIKLDEDDDT